MNARQIMNSSYHTLHPATPIGEALRVFQQASAESGRRIFGLMVTDDHDRLAGILSMHDILTLLQPKHIHIWGEMTDIDIWWRSPIGGRCRCRKRRPWSCSVRCGVAGRPIAWNRPFDK